MKIIIGILIPFLWTTLGAFMVYFMKEKNNRKIQNVLLGFAFGFVIMMILDVALG